IWNQPQNGSVAYQMVTKLKVTKKEIKKWNFQVFGNVNQHIKEVEQKIQEVQKQHQQNDIKKIK
ncbi:hypothetical protein MKX03_013278, partial [Papaver bracteatum]